MFRLIASVTGSRVVASIIQAVTLLILTRGLEVELFGQFAATSAASGMASVVLGFGLNTLALRIAAFEDSRQIAATIAMLRVPAVLASALVTTVVALLLMGSDSTPIVLAAVLYAAAESLGEGVESLLYGSSRTSRAQVALISRRVVVLAGVMIGIGAGDLMAGLCVGAGLVCVAVGLMLQGTLARPAGFKRVFREARSYWAPTMLAKLQTLDVSVAAIAMPGVAAGVYSAAARVTSPLNTFTIAALSVLTPRLSSRFEGETRDLLFRQSRRSMYLVALILTLISPLVGLATEFVVGESYSGVAFPAAILTVMTGVAALTQLYVAHFFAIGDGNTVAKIRLVVMPAMLLLGFLLGTIWGPVGMALAVLLGQVGLWVWLALAYKKRPDPPSGP
ncbi:oligosaccharide flippase family protein [Microbacterium sp. H1-D42]|uniref:lipopolysaccharide biosynthesis protein n=1 Tax=Microbacterium sp. H1-D42 TaxID=2925844 RepID=UPI001F538E18|nr:oligosaccharide flippase family protein [Microbacterium sp. H1-D42]UNK70115.1 oligosaccharide flippase family protein [Microbacterium sp. H1-D42]